MCWNYPWKLIIIENSKVEKIEFWFNIYKLIIVFFSYRIFKFVKLPNCVGIVPEIERPPIDLQFTKNIEQFKQEIMCQLTKKKKEYSSITFWGVKGVPSQVIPSCPHNSVWTSQSKVPFEVNEL